jgi:glutathione S-transferase
VSAIKLYDWPPSPFCRKVRAILDYKGIAYARLPALAHRRALARRGGTGKVPALELDGEMIFDSTAIAHRLDERFPSPPLQPSAPPLRARCHVVEDWADESLYFFGLYFHWHEPAGRKRVASYFARTLLGRVAYPALLFRIERQLWGQGMRRKSAAHIRADLQRNLEAVESLLSEHDYVLGNEPYLCDFALMAQLVYLRSAPATAGVPVGPRTDAFLERMRALRRC